MTWQSDFEHLDDRFTSCVKGSARVEKLAEGCRWAEGPAYFPAGRYVVWSDIPNDRIMRWDETSGVTSVFRQPAGYTNGHTVDRQGRLVSCHHGYPGLTRRQSAPEFECRIRTGAQVHRLLPFGEIHAVPPHSDPVATRTM